MGVIFEIRAAELEHDLSVEHIEWPSDVLARLEDCAVAALQPLIGAAMQ